MSKYAEFYTLINKQCIDKEDIISAYTGGRTTSLRALTDKELRGLCASIRERGTPSTGRKPFVPDNNKGDALRKAIISNFHKMRYDNPVEAAKAWAEKMGVGSGADNVKKPFNKYTNQELMVLLNKSQKALDDFNYSLRKKHLNA